MPISNDELKMNLMKDVAQAEATASAGRGGRGLAGSPVTSDETFVPRAVRAQGRIMGEKELNDNRTAMKDAVEHLLSETSITDELEQGKFRQEMTKKLNQLRMLGIKKANDLKLEMKRQGLNTAQQEQTASMFGDLMRNVGSGIMGNFGKASGGGGVPSGGFGQNPMGDIAANNYMRPQGSPQ